MRAVSTARTLGLVRQASIRTPSAASAGPGGARLALAVCGQPARGVVLGRVLGVAVAQQPDHVSDPRS